MDDGSPPNRDVHSLGHVTVPADVRVPVDDSISFLVPRLLRPELATSLEGPA